jgi:hypothetical protein
MWYHTLNAGFRTRVSGETDFPCIFDDRVGIGRSYVKLKGKPNYADWCEGIQQGRTYVGDGRSHFLEFSASLAARGNDGAAARVMHMGEDGGELKIAEPSLVRLNAKVAAQLGETPDPAFSRGSPPPTPYWHIERARIPGTREVPVEVVVNGYPVATNNIVADGVVRELGFDVKIDRSSWVTLRILPSSHTNPIWVMVGDKPVRASRRSVQWCLDGVDKCWSQKQRFIASAEMEDAKKAYEHARQTYRRVLAECEVD